MRIRVVSMTLLLLMAGCSSSSTDDTTVTSMTLTTTTVADTTTIAADTTSTTTTGSTTTTTGFVAPPETEPNPQRDAFVGVWRWSNTHTVYIQLLGHGVIGHGSIADGDLQFTSFGEWDVDDGVMTIRFLDLGFGGCGDIIGTYAVERSGSNFVMRQGDDACDGRYALLIGENRTSRTWLPVDSG